MPDITTETPEEARTRHCLQQLEILQVVAASAAALGASELDIIRACFGREGATPRPHFAPTMLAPPGERAALHRALTDLVGEHMAEAATTTPTPENSDEEPKP